MSLLDFVYLRSIVKRKFWLAAIIAFLPILVLSFLFLFGIIEMNYFTIIPLIIAMIWLLILLWQFKGLTEIDEERKEWSVQIEQSTKKFKYCPKCLFQIEVSSSQNKCPKCNVLLNMPEG